MSELAPEATPDGGEPAPEGESTGEPWAGPDQETWEQTQARLDQQQEAIDYFTQLAQPQSPFQQQEQGPEQIQLDPLDDQFQSQLDQYIDQKFSGYAEYVQAQQYREGSARAEDILADEIAKNGDYLFAESKDKARALANNYIGEMNQQYPGNQTQAAEAALNKAAADVRAWEASVKEAAIEQYKNELAGLSGARRDIPAGGINGQQFNMPTGGSLVDVAYRHGGGR
jgi:hypothetical protein